MQPHPLPAIPTRGRPWLRHLLATRLLDYHERYLKSTSSNNPPQPQHSPRPIKVVCISDTHNTQPIIPPGDILIHAGDLTSSGTFDEIQAGISWLSSQPHRFKFLIAGNHDVLLDDVFLQKYPAQRHGDDRTRHDLDWGTVEHLHDTWTTIEIPVTMARDHDQQSDSSSSRRRRNQPSAVRKVTLFGSPRTPKYGVWAFQYAAGGEEGEEHWTKKVANMGKAFQASRLRSDDDDEAIILITHGPPKLYLDRRDFSHHAGCPYLMDAVYKLRPRLHVFGHIHAGYGVKEDVVLDRVRQAHDDVVIGWGGVRTILLIVFFMIWERVRERVGLGRARGRERDRVTTFVNASIVGGVDNELRNQPIVVEI